MTKTEYETDFYKWTVTQTNLLKKGEFDKLDMVNLIDEVESIGKQVIHEFSDDVTLILFYMLLQKHSPESISDFMRYKIALAKSGMEHSLEDCPSLRRRLYSQKAYCYKLACNEFALDTKLYDLEHPEKCPWSLKEILNVDCSY